tara:strand:- start:11098 stop:12411 length:1314 start_codon:yes stop_codon:yes gene_type:complete
MLDKLQQHIDKSNLLDPNDSLLLTVSGGKDSVCMLHLFVQLDYPLAIAHCNFSLRDVDSDEDESFVKGLANQYGLPFFSKRFETNKYAKEKGISTQMAARDLRYAWFQELGFDKIATAHHQDDHIETLLLKKSRKASLEGLCGIPVKNRNIIRPLLCFSAQEIENFLLQNEWEWREDASNASTHYQRNEIRLLQLPSMENENPNIRKELLQEISVNQQKYAELQEEFKQLFPFVWKKGDTHQELYLKELLNHPQKEDLMYELLKEYGPFSWQDVFTLMEAESGKEVRNKYYRLIKNRDSLLLVVNKTQKQASVQIDKSICAIEVPIALSFSVLKKSDVMDFSDASMAFIDLSKLFFPLSLRKWKQGDVFVPLGMQGHKKVSDFMVDEKLSILEKENTWVLCSNDDIVWVVGHRLDDRYKLVAQTEKVYLVQTLKTTK